MITTVHVEIKWASDNAKGPVLHREPVEERLRIADPRVLLGAQQALATRPGVNQAPDLVSAIGIPYFAVALEDIQQGNFGRRWDVTTLLAMLTEPLSFHVAFAAEGGWKTVPVTLTVAVMG